METTTWDASFTLVNYSCILGYASGTGCNELVPEVGTVMETSADSKKRALGNYELLDLIGTGPMGGCSRLVAYGRSMTTS